MPVSKRLRYEVLRRDSHRCRYCGLNASEAELTVDHVIPVALGGDDKPENLVACCKDCNAGKSASSPDAPLVTDVAFDALRWSKAMAWAAEQQRANHAAENELIEVVNGVWTDWSYGPENNKREVPRPPHWRSTVTNWRIAGLEVDEIVDAILIAMRAEHVSPDSTWRYTCGICKRRLMERQELARGKLTRDAIEAVAESFGMPEDL